MCFAVADTTGKVVEGCFSTERSIGHPKQLTAVISGVVGWRGWPSVFAQAD